VCLYDSTSGSSSSMSGKARGGNPSSTCGPSGSLPADSRLDPFGLPEFRPREKSLGRLCSSAWSPYQASMPGIASSGCTQSVADPSFGAGEDRHGRCGDTGGPDSEPARVWVVAARQRADGLDAGVRREKEEASGDQLLCSPSAMSELRRLPVKSQSTNSPTCQRAGRSVTDSESAAAGRPSLQFRAAESQPH
jgi:hypothetical protein